jgi:prepilin-type N-terminal cleavage/methylation domain-containing protein
VVSKATTARLTIDSMRVNPAPFSGAENGAGFTLIESIVSLAVVALLTTLLLTASVSARRNTAARIGAEQFAGFLRETAALAVNGVKDPTCPVLPTDLAYPDCSRYTVAPVAGDQAAYTRQSVAGGTVVQRTLPQGARFGAGGDLTFCYTPPSLAVVADPLFCNTPPGGSWTVEVTHVSGTPAWRICVSSSGTVDVRSAANPNAC